MMNFSNEQYSIILPARIVEFFPANQTATVLVCTDRITHNSDTTDNVEARTPIEGVPVHTPQGGGWSMTFPIKPGDTCLMLFSQTGYDHWLYEDADTAGLLAGLPRPHLLRKFKEDDGFCFVGINTMPRVIPDYHATSAQMRGPVAADQVISLNDDNSIDIDSALSVTINAPTVTVNCDTAEVNATTNMDINTPITAISDNVTIGGTLEVTGAVTNLDTVDNTGIVTNLAAVNTTGITTTGGIAVAGGAAADMGSGDMTSTGTMSVNGVDVETHVHPYTWTDGAGSGNTSPPA